MIFVFNCTSATEIYTLSLHDALPISRIPPPGTPSVGLEAQADPATPATTRRSLRSEEHTSELQSHSDLVCRLLLEKKKCNATDADSYCYQYLYVPDQRPATGLLHFHV